MHEQTDSTPSSEQPTQISVQPTAQQMSETFMAQAMQIMTSNSYTPTQAQVDKMLSLQEKGMDYIHNERTHFSPQLISTLFILGLASILVVGLFVFCVFYAPQYASQIISAALGVVAGGTGGYGYGATKGRKKDSND